MKKKKSAGKALLWIPIQLVLSIAILCGGIYLDYCVWTTTTDTVGHGVPIFTILGGALAGLLFLIVTIVAIVTAIKRAAQDHVAAF